MKKIMNLAMLVMVLMVLCVSCDPGQDHVHSYTEEVVSDLYKYSDATCTSKAVYFKSCKCGMPGMEKFEAGELAAHDYVGGVCSVCSATQVFSVGDLGPAGGYIFYDCDADNTEADPDGADNLKSDVCGWRYLEAAPTDITKGETSVFPFGYCMNNACNGYLNLGTERGIGTGEGNTKTLVYYMGNDPYVSDPLNNPYDETTSPDYAAKLCADYELTVGEQVYDKWFLPSADELYLMLNNLKKNGIGSFDGESYYWSSSEDPGYSTYSKSVDFSEASGGIGSSMRLCGLRVRPVRAF